MESKKFRLGTGAGFSADRLDPAIDLVRRGNLNAIVFECLGERTLASALRDKLADPTLGYNPLLEKRMKAVLPLCRASNTCLITNMGAANPIAAGNLVANIAVQLGLQGIRIVIVTGDDVTDLLTDDAHLEEPDCSIKDFNQSVVGANAYLGSEGIVQALQQKADVVITGRVADPSLFLAPLQHFFEWEFNDWVQAGAGTMIGHLMECAAQVTGGYFADPDYKVVNELATVGFPIAEVQPDGTATITKLDETGGCVDLRTVKEQLLYEVHDPAKYLTPDVTADFSSARLNLEGTDRVSISGARGTEWPQQLKTTVSFDGGFLGEAELSYAGAGAEERARMANEIVEERLRHVHGIQATLRCDLIGISSLHSTAGQYGVDSKDVRIRCAIRTPDRKEAENLLWEVESLLCCGPAGGGGYRGNIQPSVLTYTTYVDRAHISPRLDIIDV
jgi:hypothetical protein